MSKSPLTPEQIEQNRIAFRIKSEETIKRFGWMIQGVFPTQECRAPGGYAYTIGLSDVGLPEILVFGLPQEVAGYILNDLAEKMKTGEVKISHGLVLDELANLPVRFKKLTQEMVEKICTQAYYRAAKGGRSISVFMMELPDAQGLFPDNPLCDQKMKTLQNLVNYV